MSQDQQQQRVPLDARLPGADLPADLLRRAKEAAGHWGFARWIRSAMEEKLARDGAGSPAGQVEEGEVQADQ